VLSSLWVRPPRTVRDCEGLDEEDIYCCVIAEGYVLEGDWLFNCLMCE
jgi:hypothetical protein